MIHRHHRRKGDRTDNRPVNILLVDPEIHEWIEKHPEEARELGWSVSRYDDPEAVSVTIPKTILVEKKPRKKLEAPRKRAVVSIRVPKDEQEDGADVLNKLIQQVRERLAPVLGLQDDCPAYYVLVPALNDWLTYSHEAQEEEEAFLNTPTTEEE